MSRCITILGCCLALLSRAAAQNGNTLAAGMPEARFLTSTGVSLAFPVGSLQQVAQNGRGTSFTIEYQITPRLSIAGGWDANFLPVQTTKLVHDLDPVLKVSVSQLKGAYQTNTFGLFGIWYGPNHPLRPYLVAGAGLNVITVPRLAYDAPRQLLSIESATNVAGFMAASIGINWQFSKPVAAFGELGTYLVPAGSPVAAGGNHFLTARMGLRFPLF